MTKIQCRRHQNETDDMEAADIALLDYGELAFSAPDRVFYVGTNIGSPGKFLSEGQDNTYMSKTHDANVVTSAKISNWDTAYSSIFSGAYNDLTGKPTLFSGSYNDLTDKPTLFSGSYNDLANKPTIPSELTDLNGVQGIGGATVGDVLTYIGSANTYEWNAPAAGDTVSKSNLAGTLATFNENDTLYIGDTGNDTTLVVRGNFQVEGTTTTLNSTNLTVDDKTITVAEGSADGTAADSAGLIVDCGSSTDADLKWINAGTIGGVGSQRYWTFSDNLRLAPATGVGRLEIAGAGNGVITMTNTLGGSTDVITNGAWTGDNLTEGQITGANFSNWNTAYTDRNKWNGGVIGDGSSATLDGALSSLGIGPGNGSKFGTTAGTVAEGDHTHSSSSITTIDGGSF